MPRWKQIKVLEGERRRRRSEEWGEWRRENGPRPDAPGWVGRVPFAMVNDVFCVLVRDAGTAIHLAVSSLSGERPTWNEMQRIKNELMGPDATAVEVYPPQSEVVDGADMFHIWVLFEPLPFSLFEGAGS